MPAPCAACGRPLTPFPVPSGMWSGTVAEIPKLGADNGFVCEACGEVVCPVCSGNRASRLGVRQFVCTECGHTPLKRIYREQ